MQKGTEGNQEEIFSKVLRAGRRTYFFDVRETKASDYYLTITESKKFTEEDGSYHYKKEDFQNFKDSLEEMTAFITKERGLEVISERHQKNVNKENSETIGSETNSFTDFNFEDI